MKKKQKIILILFVLIIIGLVLRVYNLGIESVWLDESDTISHIQQPTIARTIQSVIDEKEALPPLYFILLRFWSQYFGVSVFALRFFSLIFGVLSIFLIYKLGETIFNKKVALLSAFMLSFSMINVLYSQEMRLYSFFTFLTILSFFLFARILKKDNHSDYIWYILVTTISLYTVHFAFVVIFLQAFFILLFRERYKKIMKNFFLSQLFSIVLFLPFIKHFIISLYDLYIMTFNIVKKYNAPQIFASQYGTLLFLLLLFIIFIFASFYLKNKLTNKKIRFNEKLFIFIFILGIMLYMVNIKRLITPFFLTKYTIYLTPILYIALAKCITLIKKKKLRIALISALFIISCFSLSIYYKTTTKEEWESVAYYIEKESSKDDIILFDADYMIMPFDYYYKGDLETVGLPSNKSEHNIGFFEDLSKSKFVDKYGIWLILSNNYRNEYLYRDLLAKSYNPALNKSYKGIELYYYELG